MFEFEQPLWLLLLVALPAVGWWYYRAGRLREGVVRYSALSLFKSVNLTQGRRKSQLLLGLKFLIILLMTLALARPRISNVVRETEIEIIDIMLVLDISSSMRAADFKPNRLEAAKDVARQFILDRPVDRMGLIVFGGESFIQCPLTTDTNVLLNLLDQVTIVSKEHDGTAIGMAIANAINRLRDSPSKSKVMILLSDGSNNKGELDPTTAAEMASEFGIKIYTIGAGSQGTAPYPVDDPVWGQRMVTVEVDLDEETLRNVAEITHALYFRATDKESLAEIYGQINDLERTEIRVNEFLNHRELYGWLVIPATLLGLGLPVLITGIFKKYIS